MKQKVFPAMLIIRIRIPLLPSTKKTRKESYTVHVTLPAGHFYFIRIYSIHLLKMRLPIVMIQFLCVSFFLFLNCGSDNTPPSPHTSNGRLF